MVQNTCYTCGQTFSRKYNLQRHIDNVHKHITSEKCETCDKIFTRKDNLTQHIKRVHKYSSSQNGHYNHVILTVSIGEGMVPNEHLAPGVVHLAE